MEKKINGIKGLRKTILKSIKHIIIFTIAERHTINEE